MIRSTGWVPPAIRRLATDSVHQVVNAAHRFVRQHPRLKRALRPVTHLVLPSIMPFRSGHIARADYERWVAEQGMITAADEAAMRADIARFPYRPLLSVVMATYETPEPYLRAAIASLQSQIYADWELCVADDGSSAPHVTRILDEIAASDPRVHVIRRPVRGHISAASNSALGLAQGAWVVLMDHDDLLPRDALYELAAEIVDHPEARIIYTDEDKIDGQDRRYSPYFKPDFDPDLLLGQNLLNHLTAYRRDLIQSVGGFREGFEGAQDHDLALRATAACGPDAVRHIPRVLYHWRQQTGTQSFSETAMARCVAVAGRAIADHLRARNVAADILPTAGIYHRIVFPVPEPAPLVSILIPTRNRADLLRVCLDGLLKQTDYPAIEVLIADNGSTEPDALALLQAVLSDPRVRVLALPGPFNFAHLTNQAAAEARGDILLLLNNDIEIIDSGWLREMVSHAIRLDIGAVGCRLLYPNGRLQHGGTVLGIGRIGGHFLVGAHREEPGPFGVLNLLRSASAVTAACLAVRRAVWQQVGGMDETNLAIAFNDVDLCLKIRKLGLRIVWTPFAELYHHESASRGHDRMGPNAARFQREADIMVARWGDILLNDPYYSPNYTLENADCTLASPPRRQPRYRTAPATNR
ncbi:glycosyltransferase family 2 protein [Gluconacetobacter asukensis]|uniref:Glycosyltransferase family 2 protein n=1 Tax=Gluconacetobacter asukensis TaxID=1017181 RepID=A0A7W4IZ40_9PROT|nr:glycosyltransferase family 2 protein [Gluconacetobacter asukensis]MBB2171467.1 glycosyltransferase family 2 protein [Gluconacetobacter asukensis]